MGPSAGRALANAMGLSCGPAPWTAGRVHDTIRAELVARQRGQPARQLQARVSRHDYRSLGVRPVWRAMRASILGPISSESWNANTKSGQPPRAKTRCEQDSRLMDQPMRRRAARTRRALAA